MGVKARKKRESWQSRPEVATATATLRDRATAQALLREAHPRDESIGRNIAGWLFPTYLGIIFLGFQALCLPQMMPGGQKFGAVHALFTAVNAGTLTALPQAVEPLKYGVGAQIVLLILIWCGSFISMFLGSMAVCRICRLPYSDLQIALADAIAHVCAIGAGTLAMGFNPTRTVWQTFFLASSAFCNSGLHIGGLPGVASAQTHVVILPLSIVGGIGLPVLMELFDWARSRSTLSQHSRTVLLWTAGLYIGGTLLILPFRLAAIKTGYDLPDGFEQFRTQLAASAAQAINSRTAGFGFESLNQAPRSAVWIMMVLFVIGGASAGSAGGLKCNSLAQLFNGFKDIFALRFPGRAFRIGLTWLGFYLLTGFACVLLLVQHIPAIPGDHLLLLAFSALSNVGLANEPIDPDRISAYILSATMLIGRFAPLMVLWWMSDTTSDADIAVG